MILSSAWPPQRPPCPEGQRLSPENGKVTLPQPYSQEAMLLSSASCSWPHGHWELSQVLGQEPLSA